MFERFGLSVATELFRMNANQMKMISPSLIVNFIDWSIRLYWKFRITKISPVSSFPVTSTFMTVTRGSYLEMDVRISSPIIPNKTSESGWKRYWCKLTPYLGLRSLLPFFVENNVYCNYKYNWLRILTYLFFFLNLSCAEVLEIRMLYLHLLKLSINLAKYIQGHHLKHLPFSYILIKFHKVNSFQHENQRLKNQNIDGIYYV